MYKLIIQPIALILILSLAAEPGVASALGAGPVPSSVSHGTYPDLSTEALSLCSRSSLNPPLRFHGLSFAAAKERYYAQLAQLPERKERPSEYWDSGLGKVVSVTFGELMDLYTHRGGKGIPTDLLEYARSVESMDNDQLRAEAESYLGKPLDQAMAALSDPGQFDSIFSNPHSTEIMLRNFLPVLVDAEKVKKSKDALMATLRWQIVLNEIIYRWNLPDEPSSVALMRSGTQALLNEWSLSRESRLKQFLGRHPALGAAVVEEVGLFSVPHETRFETFLFGRIPTLITSFLYLGLNIVMYGYSGHAGLSFAPILVFAATLAVTFIGTILYQVGAASIHDNSKYRYIQFSIRLLGTLLMSVMAFEIAGYYPHLLQAGGGNLSQLIPWAMGMAFVALVGSIFTHWLWDAFMPPWLALMRGKRPEGSAPSTQAILEIHRQYIERQITVSGAAVEIMGILKKVNPEEKLSQKSIGLAAMILTAASKGLRDPEVARRWETLIKLLGNFYGRSDTSLLNRPLREYFQNPSLARNSNLWSLFSPAPVSPGPIPDPGNRAMDKLVSQFASLGDRSFIHTKKTMTFTAFRYLGAYKEGLQLVQYSCGNWIVSLLEGSRTILEFQYQREGDGILIAQTPELGMISLPASKDPLEEVKVHFHLNGRPHDGAHLFAIFRDQTHQDLSAKKGLTAFHWETPKGFYSLHLHSKSQWASSGETLEREALTKYGYLGLMFYPYSSNRLFTLPPSSVSWLITAAFLLGIAFLARLLLQSQNRRTLFSRLGA